MNKKQRIKKDKYKKNHIGIIHGEKVIYTNKIKNTSGKRQNKNTCVYYDKITMKCNNDKCSKSICTTAHNCTVYKRKHNEAVKSKGLSPYDENHIKTPYKASIHESNNIGAIVGKNIGVPMHTEFLKANGKRRHKARCIHYRKDIKKCILYIKRCIGSSHCTDYKEK